MSEEVVEAGPDDPPETTGPPIIFLLLGAVSVVSSLVLLVGGGFSAHVVGYLLASLLPILSVGVFRRFDLERRTNPFYLPRPVVSRIIPAILVLGLLAAVVHTWAIATDIAS